VWYFKRTKGKRIFLMSPYHHHLELKGLSEWQIDFYLWSVGLVLAIIGIVLGVWV
jgi:phospho-N-acetylmuramoyl-pentapeptide-transferase